MSGIWTNHGVLGLVLRRTATARRPGENLDEIRDELAGAWGDPRQERQAAWDLFMRVGKVSGR